MGALIFDFDGVIADSEAIANTVLAEIVTGRPELSGRGLEEIFLSLTGFDEGKVP